MTRYTYPGICCRCAASTPSNSWDVQSYDSAPGPRNSTISITSTAKVPVCAACHGALTWLWCGCWFVALLVGAASAWFIYQWASHRPHADTVPVWINRGMPMFFGLLIAGGCGWALKAFFINYDFAWFDPATQQMTFKSKEYQQAFDRLNDVSGWPA
jgi:hypothetical protein